MLLCYLPFFSFWWTEMLWLNSVMMVFLVCLCNYVQCYQDSCQLIIIHARHLNPFYFYFFTKWILYMHIPIVLTIFMFHYIVTVWSLIIWFFFGHRRPGGDRIYNVFDNQLPAALRKLPFDRHLSIQNVKKVVSEADGYQPHLIAPEQGYRRLIESSLSYFRGPSEASVDAVSIHWSVFFSYLNALAIFLLFIYTDLGIVM